MPSDTKSSIKTVGVVGAGTMGQGIMQVFAQSGFEVLAYDVADGAVAKAIQGTDRFLTKSVEKGKLDVGAKTAALEHIKPCGELGDLKAADLVLEATTESLEVKEEVLREEPLYVLPKEVLRDEFEFTNIVRAAAFRDLLLYFYEFKCAVTESAIKYKGLYNLEAAHIIPDTYGGPSHPKNGLPLSRDFHWAFDKGFFTIDEKYRVIVHTKVKSIPALSKVNGKNIFLPEDSRARPSEFALDWHRKHVFGIFSKS